MRVFSTPDPANEAAVVTLVGQLDIDTRATLDAALTEQLSTGTHRIVIDVSGLTFCDSTGLSALLVAYRQCVAKGGYVHLAGPSDFLLGILRAVGLLGVIPVFDDVPAALR